MITARLQCVLHPSGDSSCTLWLEHTLPTDEVSLHIAEPFSRGPEPGSILILIDPNAAARVARSSSRLSEVLAVAYDEQRQQHHWRGHVPDGRLLLILVSRARGNGLGGSHVCRGPGFLVQGDAAGD